MATAMVTATPLEIRPTLPRPRLVVVPPPATVFRRRRVVVAGVLLVVIVMAALVAGRVSTVLGGNSASVPEHRPRTAYVVQPGDTLWSVARSLQPEGDLRPLVRGLSQANGGAALAIGQVLALP